MYKNVSENRNMELTDHVNFSNFVYLFKSMKNLCCIIWCARSLWYYSCWINDTVRSWSAVILEEKQLRTSRCYIKA